MRNKTKWLRVLLGLVLGALTVAAPVVMPFHANVAFAQESAEYPDVPQNHWAYAAINKLSQVGLTEAISNGGTCMGCMPLTRYQFAVAVARILDKVGAKPNGAQCMTDKTCMPGLPKTVSDGSGFVKRPEIIDAISALRIEFRPELKDLGVRVDGLDKRVLGFSDKPPKLTVTPSTQTKGRAANYVNEYPDAPQNHWAYIAIRRLIPRENIEGMPNDTNRTNKPITRYDFAVTLARFLEKVDPARPRRAAASSGAIGDQSPVGANATIPDNWTKRPGWIDDIKALCNEFAPEMKGLGVPVDELEKRIINVYDVYDVLAKPPILTITPRIMISGSAADYISAGNDGKATPQKQ